MKTVLTLIISMLISGYSIGQTTKFRFDIDGSQFLSIKKNAGGFNYIHQTNLQTSMFFGFNSGKNTIVDPMVFNSGKNNTAYGFNTLSANTSGLQNTAIGSYTLEDNTTGNSSVGIGFAALKHGITAHHNIGIGKSALYNNLAGVYNVAIGSDAFNNTNFAERSVAIGSTAGVNDTSSIDNVYIGFGAGRGTILATDGYDRSNNVMLGSNSGYYCKTSGNVFLGFKSGFNAKVDNQLYITNSNTDSLSSLIYGQFDNSLLRINGDLNIDGLYTLPNTAPSVGQYLKFSGGANLSWDDVADVWSYGAGDDALYEDGDVGIGLGNAVYRLDVEDNVSNGYVARFHNSNNSTAIASKGIIIQAGKNTNPTSSTYYALFLDGNGTNVGGIRGNSGGGTMYSTTSDRRLKQNIKTFTSGIETISKIRPTIYQMKSNPTVDEVGFIAQELLEILPIAVGGSPDDDVNTSPMTVDYSRITPLLVAAIQEQQELIKTLEEKLDSQYNELRAEISKLQGIAKK